MVQNIFATIHIIYIAMLSVLWPFDSPGSISWLLEVSLQELYETWNFYFK